MDKDNSKTVEPPKKVVTKAEMKKEINAKVMKEPKTITKAEAQKRYLEKAEKLKKIRFSGRFTSLTEAQKYNEWFERKMVSGENVSELLRKMIIHGIDWESNGDYIKRFRKQTMYGFQKAIFASTHGFHLKINEVLDKLEVETTLMNKKLDLLINLFANIVPEDIVQNDELKPNHTRELTSFNHMRLNMEYANSTKQKKRAQKLREIKQTNKEWVGDFMDIELEELYEKDIKI